jgi:cobalamin biosynthesis Mg chelatase CobN
MSLTITASSPANLIPARSAPVSTAAVAARRATVAVAAHPPAASATTSAAQANAELNQLLSKYKNDLAHGQPASRLSGLGRQIMAAAKAAGQNVSLPRAPANSGEPAAPPVANTAPEVGKIGVIA